MEEKVLQILGEQCEDALYYDGDSMMQDGVIDSFTVLSLVNNLEEEFDIEIEPKYVVAENFKNKDAVVALCEEVLQADCK